MSAVVEDFDSDSDSDSDRSSVYSETDDYYHCDPDARDDFFGEGGPDLQRAPREACRRRWRENTTPSQRLGGNRAK